MVRNAAQISLLEQPLPVENDAVLTSVARTISICADESVKDAPSLSKLVGKYDAVNIKLDKAGGLTEALNLADCARRAGLATMVGCTLGTSLAIAPAILVAQGARVADLDGPLFLSSDRRYALRYDHSLVYPPDRALWG